MNSRLTFRWAFLPVGILLSALIAGCAGMTVQEAFFGSSPLPWDKPGPELVVLPPAKTVGVVVVGAQLKSPLSNSHVLHRFDHNTLLTHKPHGFGIGNKIRVQDDALGPPPAQVGTVYPSGPSHHEYQGLAERAYGSFEHIFAEKGIRSELLNYKPYMADYSQENTLGEIVSKVSAHDQVDLIAFVFFEALRAWSIEETPLLSPTKTFKGYSGAWLVGRCVAFRTDNSEKVLDVSFSRDNLSIPEIRWRTQGLGAVFDAAEADLMSKIKSPQSTMGDNALRYGLSQEAYIRNEDGKSIFRLNVGRPVQLVDSALTTNQADSVQVRASGWVPASLIISDQPVYLWPYRKAGLRYQAKENNPVNVSPGQDFHYEAIGEILPGAVLQETGRSWPLWSRAVQFDGTTASMDWEPADSLWKHVELRGWVRTDTLTSRIDEARIPGAVTGRITRSGQPVADIDVEIAGVRERTGSDGRYRFNSVPAGADYPIRVRPLRRGQWYEVALDIPVILPGQESIYSEIDLNTIVLQGEDATKAREDGTAVAEGEPIQIRVRYGRYALPAIYINDDLGRKRRVYPTRTMPDNPEEQGRAVSGTFAFYIPKGSTVEQEASP